MSKKKSVSNDYSIINLHLYGIFDFIEKEIIFVSLNSEDVEMELALKDEKFLRCEFEISLFI